MKDNQSKEAACPEWMGGFFLHSCENNETGQFGRKEVI
jgi:hypothetical protein